MHARRPLILASVVLGVLIGSLSAIGQTLPVLAGQPGMAGSVTAGVSIVMFLLSPVSVFAIGYWIGNRTDVPSNYTRISLLMGLFGGCGSFVGYVAVLFGVAPGVATQLPVLLSGVYSAVVRVVDFGVTGLAGAAVAHFRRVERP